MIKCILSIISNLLLCNINTLKDKTSTKIWVKTSIITNSNKTIKINTSSKKSFQMSTGKTLNNLSNMRLNLNTTLNQLTRPQTRLRTMLKRFRGLSHQKMRAKPLEYSLKMGLLGRLKDLR